MRFTLSMLKQFLDTTASVLEISNALTDLGLEVEEIIDRSTDFNDFCVAEIISAEPHPNADKLKVCQVNNACEILQIVCGAPNARAGIKVVLAKVGAEVPNGKLKIKAAEIRGVKSNGMLCTEEELLIGNNSNGIIELPEKAKVGEEFLSYFGLDDPVFDVSITPNRGDCISVYGVARELAAKGVGELLTPEVKSIKHSFNSKFVLSVEDSSLVPLFAMREIRNIANLNSPEWLVKQLKNIGINPVSLPVDVTNYICVSYGQPMHAYDADKITNGLKVVRITKDVSFTALNSKEYELEAGELVITDDNEVQALAGIIGGQSSACDENTKNIILEAANFNSNIISKAGRRLQIDTDSRYRFERQIDHNFTIDAMQIATEMILSLGGGDASEITLQGEEKLQERELELPVNSINKRLGINIEYETIEHLLKKLGFKTKLQADNLHLTIPSWRHDISIKEDIAEEVGRLYGYDKLVETALDNQEISRIIDSSQRRKSDTKRLLASIGYDEVVTWSFMSSKKARLFTEVKEELTLINPISKDLDYMRPSILPNLLICAAKNLARSIRDQSLFEIGPIFTGLRPDEEFISATGIRIGMNIDKNPHEKERFVDVFDIKADLVQTLENMDFAMDKCQIRTEAPSYYHPTRSAALRLGNNLIAYFGQLHPLVLKEFEIEVDVLAFEINVNNIPYAKNKFGRKDEYVVSNYQPVSRDFAFVIDRDRAVGEILSYIRNIDKKLIRSVDLFDLYVGDKLEPGKKSIAISVKLQADDHTLSETELQNISNLIISGAEARFAAKLRE